LFEVPLRRPSGTLLRWRGKDMSKAPSFDELAKQLSGPLQRYLQRFVGDPYTAEDLLQETLLRISNGLPGFEGRSSEKDQRLPTGRRGRRRREPSGGR
jgi:hypothetical protein